MPSPRTAGRPRVGAIGNPASRRAPRAGAAGFTLIEMLIVLVIISVAAGAVTLSIGAATRAPNVETEARRLAGRLQAASDDAMLGDRVLAMTVEEHGYGFSTLGPDGWTPRTDDALAFHELPSGMLVTLDTAPPVVLGADGSGKPLQAEVEGGSVRWRVVYDGMRAIALPVETK